MYNIMNASGNRIAHCDTCFEQTSNQIVKLRASESFMHLICTLSQPTLLYVSTHSSMSN